MSFHFSREDTPEILPEKLREYVPRFISNRIGDIEGILSGIEARDIMAVRSYCHRVVGVASSYHFYKMYELIASVHQKSKLNDLDGVTLMREELSDYLDELRAKL